jgi:hypothetical protein
MLGHKRHDICHSENQGLESVEPGSAFGGGISVCVIAAFIERAVFTRPPSRRSGNFVGTIPPGNREGSAFSVAT